MTFADEVPPIGLALSAFDVTARAIAAALSAQTGQAWTLDDDIIDGPNDAKLWLGVHSGRLEISGQCGEARDLVPRGVGPFVITVAIDRDPAAIAREIVRRLLPRYVPAFAAARAQLADRKAREQAAERALQDLIDAAGGGHRAAGEHQVVGYTKLESVYEIHVHQARSTADECSVDLRLRGLDVDTARNVVRLLRGAAKRSEAGA